jgi:hypothetical protein
MRVYEKPPAFLASVLGFTALRELLLARGLPVHLVNHLATMAELHCAGRYDRLSDDVRALTGHPPLSMQEFVRQNAATFTASALSA